MRYHSQNLTDGRLPMFMHGRAWLYTKRQIKLEWALGHLARGPAATITVGDGDGDDGIMLHLCIPFFFAIFVGIAGVFRISQPRSIGVAIHNCGLWVYVFANDHEWSRDMPWWEKGLHWSFPWEYNWHSTEILTSGIAQFADVIWSDTRKDRKQRDIFKAMEEQNAAAAKVSRTYDYRYQLKNGTIQERKATIHVERRTWRMRWWPLLPFKKVSTAIDVRFNDEVGEGTGSWKGGTVGCGYDMLPNETGFDCLKRMERERKFNR